MTKANCFNNFLKQKYTICSLLFFIFTPTLLYANPPAFKNIQLGLEKARVLEAIKDQYPSADIQCGEKDAQEKPNVCNAIINKPGLLMLKMYFDHNSKLYNLFVVFGKIGQNETSSLHFDLRQKYGFEHDHNKPNQGKAPDGTVSWYLDDGLYSVRLSPNFSLGVVISYLDFELVKKYKLSLEDN